VGEVSEWFWLAIEQTWLDFDRLATWLETASREAHTPRLLAYAVYEARFGADLEFGAYLENA
jgi:hypothetical protein